MTGADFRRISLAVGTHRLCSSCKGRGSHEIRGGGTGRPPIIVVRECRRCLGRGVTYANGSAVPLDSLGF